MCRPAAGVVAVLELDAAVAVLAWLHDVVAADGHLDVLGVRLGIGLLHADGRRLLIESNTMHGSCPYLEAVRPKLPALQLLRLPGHGLQAALGELARVGAVQALRGLRVFHDVAGVGGAVPVGGVVVQRAEIVAQLVDEREL